MARICEVCGKGPMAGHNVSHSHRLTNRRWLPNLQRVKALQGKRPVTLRVCTKCLKAGKVVRAT